LLEDQMAASRRLSSIDVTADNERKMGLFTHDG
jgi:hypothetical protein